jgi:hypothetical protein
MSQGRLAASLDTGARLIVSYHAVIAPLKRALSFCQHQGSNIEHIVGKATRRHEHEHARREPRAPASR